MSRNKTLALVAGIAASFIGLVGTIFFLARVQIISVAVAKLMLAALLAMYVGVGILIAIYRLLAKVE